MRQYRVILTRGKNLNLKNIAVLKLCSIKLEQPRTEQNEPIEASILKFGGL